MGKSIFMLRLYPIRAVGGGGLLMVGVMFVGLVAGGCAREDNKTAGSGGSASVAPQTTVSQPATSVAELPRVVSMKIGTGTFRLEVAANDHDREQGLMYRESMPLNHGMIFVLGRIGPASG